MFATVKKHLTDARTLSALCHAAEAAARAKGMPEPGSEHFVLAALTLPDRTAAAAFARLGLNRDAFAEAMVAQHTRALQAAGVAVAHGGAAGDRPAMPGRPVSPLYRAAPSGQALVQRLAAGRGERGARPLLSADVLVEVAAEQFTIAARAMRELGVEPERLRAAARHCLAEGAARGGA